MLEIKWVTSSRFLGCCRKLIWWLLTYAFKKQKTHNHHDLSYGITYGSVFLQAADVMQTRNCQLGKLRWNKALMNNPKQNVISSPVFGMSVFVFTEIMFFVALISAFMVIKAGNGDWQVPEGRLPSWQRG